MAEETKKKKNIVKEWFNDNVRDNPQDIKIACDLTARSCEEQFSMYIRSANSEMLAVIFYTTYESIMKFIKEKETMYSDFTIQICECLNLGFTQNKTEGNENVGGFMPICEHIGMNRRVIDTGASNNDNRTTENLLKWKELNIKKNVEMYKIIQEDAYNALFKNYGIDTRESEAIIPIFCIFMDSLIHVLKTKWIEADGSDVSQVSIRVMGLFTIFYSYYSDTDEEIIEFELNPDSKIGIKSDELAIS